MLLLHQLLGLVNMTFIDYNGLWVSDQVATGAAGAAIQANWVIIADWHNAEATTYQPLDAGLTDIAGITPANGAIIVGDGTTWSGVIASANGISLIESSDYAAMRGLLSLDTDDSVRFAMIGLNMAPVADYPFAATQTADSKGAIIYGFNDQVTHNIRMAVDYLGRGVIETSHQFVVDSGSYITLQAGANQAFNLIAGGLFQFQDRDASAVSRATIASSTGEISVLSNTVGLKLDTGGTTTLISDGTTVSVNKKLSALTQIRSIDNNGGYVQFFATGTGGSSFLGHGGSAGVFGTYSDTPLAFYTNFGEKLRLTTAGDVLIGTTTEPTANASNVVVLAQKSSDPTMGANTVGVWNNGGVFCISAGFKLGGDLDANGNTIFFGTSENIIPADTFVSIDLGSGNHHTLDCTSGSGDVDITLQVPPGPTGGTIIIEQGATGRDFTWNVDSGTIVWLGTNRPTSVDVNKVRIISWRYNGAITYLMASETN